jgi:threonine synthase
MCKTTVAKIYKNACSLIDTHTAVAVNAAEAYASDYKAENKMLVVSTASPYKFAADVLLSLTGSKPEDDLMALEGLNRYTGVDIPSPLASILTKTAIHTETINKSDMKEATRRFALK